MPTVLDERLETMERGYVLDHNGLTLVKDQMSKREWETLGRELVVQRERYGWAIIDWLLLHRDEWGKRYDHAMQVTGYSYKTLSSMYALGVAFPRDKRIPNVSRGFHRCVISLPAEQRRDMLLKAKNKQWTEEHLTSVVASMNRTRGHPFKGRTAPRKAVKVRCPHCESIFLVRTNMVKEQSDEDS